MNIKWLIFFVLSVAALFYIFVFNQWYMVSSTPTFVSVVIIFVGLSFYSSASEAAFSTAHTDTKIQKALAGDSEVIANKYNDFQNTINEVGLGNLDEKQKNLLKRIDRENIKLRKKIESLDESSRAIYVGTFASLSVFLNIALAACLPLALVSTMTEAKGIIVGIPYPYIFEESLRISWFSLDLSGQKTLVFFASAFPILVFGKVIPKEVGVLFNMLFAYRLNSLAQWLVFFFGFIPKAMSGPLALIRKLAAPHQG